MAFWLDVVARTSSDTRVTCESTKMNEELSSLLTVLSILRCSRWHSLLVTSLSLFFSTSSCTTLISHPESSICMMGIRVPSRLALLVNDISRSPQTTYNDRGRTIGAITSGQTEEAKSAWVATAVPTRATCNAVGHKRYHCRVRK